MSRWCLVSRRTSTPPNSAFRFSRRHSQALRGKESENGINISPLNFRYLCAEWRFHEVQRARYAPHAGTRLREARRAISAHQVSAGVREKSRAHVHRARQVTEPTVEAGNYCCSREDHRCEF